MKRIAALLAGAWLAAGAVAGEPGERRRGPDPEVMGSAGFLDAHPDMKWRAHGVEQWRKGAPERALEYFRRGARHADKPSQAMLAEMYWTGQGVERDRALGYVWMDLAAERHYRTFLLKREQYWAALSDEERARAIEVGGDMYEVYGDVVAKPRLERVLRRARQRMTGSRTGFGGNALKVEIPGPDGRMRQIDGSRFYDPEFWEPERYWAWQDEVWDAPPRGSVEVGELEILRTPDAPSGD
ncbi:hypothetical protein [Coralloluteibacterium thermophilus]|uniref:Sel1 repeat family protein n=1 Tax=Coralloluteibacterium thermophilum TaxID=2707049 RepID=A0ABV9NK32_9GAMM